jgi:hypothetical protein
LCSGVPPEFAVAPRLTIATACRRRRQSGCACASAIPSRTERGGNKYVGVSCSRFSSVLRIREINQLALCAVSEWLSLRIRFRLVRASPRRVPALARSMREQRKEMAT